MRRFPGSGMWRFRRRDVGVHHGPAALRTHAAGIDTLLGAGSSFRSTCPAQPRPARRDWPTCPSRAAPTSGADRRAAATRSSTPPCRSVWRAESALDTSPHGRRAPRRRCPSRSRHGAGPVPRHRANDHAQQGHRDPQPPSGRLGRAVPGRRRFREMSTVDVPGMGNFDPNEPPLVLVVSSMAGGAGASMALDVCRLLTLVSGLTRN